MRRMSQGALAQVDFEHVIQRIAQGEYQSHIARELGVAPPSLHERISKHPLYKQALKLRNMAKLDSSQSGIEAADSLPNLARAREAFKAAAWRAERECPDEWGQRTQIDVTVDLGSDLAELARRRQSRMVDDAAQHVIENVATVHSAVTIEENNDT